MAPALARAWEMWIAASVLRGVQHHVIVAALVEEGLDGEAAQRAVAEIAGSPATEAVGSAIRPMLSAARLRREVLRSGSSSLARIPADATLYRDGFALMHTPVVLEGLLTEWPALAWTWWGLRQRWGELRLEVQVGANAVDPRLEAPSETRTFGALIDAAVGDSEERLILKAENAAYAGPLSCLRVDLRDLPGIATLGEAGCDFWIAPEGAGTALHRDRSTTLLGQILGRKTVWLLAPEEDVEISARVYWAEPIDLDDPSRGVKRVTLEPGEVLSIPAGWWHQTRCESPCLSVSLANLVFCENRFVWPAEGTDAAL